MKKLLILSCLAVMACTGGTEKTTYPVGTSSALWKSPTAADMKEAVDNGIGYIEVAMNQLWRGVPPEEVEGRVMRMKEMIDSAGIRVWSVHLPFSRTLDISVTDDSLRSANVRLMADMIRLSSVFSPERLVLHPSSEPIEDNEREARLANATASVAVLKPVADSVGALICMENLPRTCLGSRPAELLHIVRNVPGVWVTFDTNHYLEGTPEEYMDVIGPYIKTVHVSDYDFEDERHWLPGQGSIDWPLIMAKLRDAGYDGVFMYEVTKNSDGSRVTPGELAENFYGGGIFE